MSEQKTILMQFEGWETGLHGASTVPQQSVQRIAAGTVHAYAIPVGEDYADLAGGTINVAPGDHEYKSATFDSAAGVVVNPPQAPDSAWGYVLNMNFSYDPTPRGRGGSPGCSPKPVDGLVYWNICASSPGLEVAYAVQYGFTPQ